jgi:hypothetical protein
MAQGERRGRRWGERRERDREALRLFFLDYNDYVAPLLIVLGKLLLSNLMSEVPIDVYLPTLGNPIPIEDPPGMDSGAAGNPP